MEAMTRLDVGLILGGIGGGVGGEADQGIILIGVRSQLAEQFFGQTGPLRRRFSAGPPLSPWVSLLL